MDIIWVDKDTEGSSDSPLGDFQTFQIFLW